MTEIYIVIGVLGTITKRLVQVLDDLEIRDRVGIYLNHFIVEIGQKTKKYQGDLRRLAVTHTSVENYQLTLVWKTHKRVMAALNV